MININKPKFDLRDYKGGVMDNEIKYVLINDVNLESSYVTIAVNIGSYANPKEYNGLAHFLEHMLFLGSHKYPKEDHYFSRLSKLGGYSNAYTDTFQTVYYFNVFNNGLLEIFDIFSRFFIDPLFKEDCVQRELNAVNNEHLKNINNDNWIYNNFLHSLANNSSSVNTFTTGNLNTLQKPDIREQLLEFYKNYYTTNNISICIASSKPIQELKDIIDNTFGNIKSSHGKEFIIEKPFMSDNKKKIFYLKSYTDIYELHFIWEIPMVAMDFNILQYILLTNTETGLSFHLKSLGYLNYISVSNNIEGLFEIVLGLTILGYKNIDYCYNALLTNIDQILNTDINLFVKYFKKIKEINFDCLPKYETESLCNQLAVNHYYYPTKHIFENLVLLSKIKNDFKKYLITDNLIIVIVANKYDNTTNFTYKKLKEYKVDYVELNIKFKPIKINNNFCNFDLDNDYLNIKPIIVTDLDECEIPKLTLKKYWYGGCSKFNEPSVFIYLQLNNKNYFTSAKAYLLSSISINIINFIASYVFNKSSEIGYSIDFNDNPILSIIYITINGLNDISKIKLVLKELNYFLLNIKTFVKKLSKEFITSLIQSYKQGFENIKFLNPHDYLHYILDKLMYKNEYDISILIKEINNITIDDIEEFLNNLLQDTIITSLIYGNIKNDDINEIFSEFKFLFNNNSNKISLLNDIQSQIIKHPNNKETSHCILYLYKIGPFIPLNVALLLILLKILSQQFFDTLRTKQQLGYIANMKQIKFINDYYIIEQVQSAKDIDFVEKKMQEFNSNIKTLIDKCNFDEILLTIKQALEEPDYSMSDKINRYLNEIISSNYLFNRNKLILNQLKKIKKEDIHIFANNIINSKNLISIIIQGH